MVVLEKAMKCEGKQEEPGAQGKTGVSHPLLKRKRLRVRKSVEKSVGALTRDFVDLDKATVRRYGMPEVEHQSACMG
jgi:hypothetical protein